ncbi:hypothetical protein VCRA2116O29_700004 [Vibrio crassostreae]|nr:hypothetical protein VCRA2116O29_700004 [Vibrio crassostreae]CAK3889423.1 hypothetical protein VCRA2123O74_690014 [Vibrio crassostreae]
MFQKLKEKVYLPNVLMFFNVEKINLTFMFSIFNVFKEIKLKKDSHV